MVVIGAFLYSVYVFPFNYIGSVINSLLIAFMLHPDFDNRKVEMSSTKISRFDFVSRLASVDNHPVIIYECPCCGSEITSQNLDDGLYYMNGDDIVCPCGDFQFSLYLDIAAYYKS